MYIYALKMEIRKFVTLEIVKGGRALSLKRRYTQNF